MKMDNHAIAEALEEIATLLELTGENPFKVRAYANGARTLEVLTEDLDQLIATQTLKGHQGIGQGLADAITELRSKGKFALLDELRASLPPGLLQMLKIPGLGPKKVRALWQQLKITDLEKLTAACEDGRVAELKGFGEKTQAKILDGIKNREAYGRRHLWLAVEPIVNEVLEGLRALPEVEKAEAAGSFRRARETVGDLDFLVASEKPEKVMAWFVAQAGIQEVTAQGETKSSIRYVSGLQADLRVVPLEQFFFALHHFTGSKDHNVQMRHRALGRGLSMSEWGLTAKDPGVKAPSAKNEEEVFKALGLKWIPPELREGQGEIEASEQNQLPKLVVYEDLRGCFHNHTLASDGRATLEQMAAAAEAMGWDYFSIADHSKSSAYANGLDEVRLLEQVKEIKALNESKRFKVHILSGSEVDILKDGTLDFDDSTLAQLDVVVASVHASMTLDEEAMTARIIRALENPRMHILGHLTGRLLLERESYKVNIAKVIDCAAANGKCIELNVNPRRLDMDWSHWHRAAEKGVLCAINPDAHRTEQFSFVRAGTLQARKGWLTKEQVLNTKPLKELLRWLHR